MVSAYTAVAFTKIDQRTIDIGNFLLELDLLTDDLRDEAAR
jgi:hypothetical protein